MPTHLYLLRHGIAVPHGTPGVSEDERPLTPKGEAHLRAVAAGLVRLGVEPEAIVSSPLPRARRTAEIVAKILGREDRVENSDELLPPAKAEAIRDWLKTRSQEKLMLVGHNPNLNELLGRFLGLTGESLPFELKKGGVAELRSEGGDSYRLQWLATPRLFRRIGG